MQLHIYSLLLFLTTTINFFNIQSLVEPYREDNVDQHTANTIRNGLRNIPETFQGNDLAPKPPRLRLIVDIYISGRK